MDFYPAGLIIYKRTHSINTVILKLGFPHMNLRDNKHSVHNTLAFIKREWGQSSEQVYCGTREDITGENRK